MEILEENLQGHPERMTKEKDFVWAKVFTKAKHRANDASHNVHRTPLSSGALNQALSCPPEDFLSAI